jgi:hypothetical protein
LGNLSTPKSVQKLQAALHAKAKAEAGYRFYALYDKISREDILAHAYAQCRANKGAAGVDGQDCADVEAYGVQRWLGELALALKGETYRRVSERSNGCGADAAISSEGAVVRASSSRCWRPPGRTMRGIGGERAFVQSPCSAPAPIAAERWARCG